MTPSQLDALSDNDYAGMLRVMLAEAEAIAANNRKMARRR